MRLRFQGLIVHTEIDAVPEGRKIQIAVLMQHSVHRPVLTVRTADLKPGTNAPVIGTGPGVKCFSLKDRVTNSLGNGTATTVSLSRVPQIDRLRSGGGGIHPNVATRAAHANFHAYVELPPGGTLAVEDFYLDQVNFGATPFGCLGRTVSYDLIAAGNVTFTISGKDVVVDKNAILRISNREHDKTPGPSDYDAYKKFYRPAASAIEHPKRITPCDEGTAAPAENSCGEDADLEVDCSNTRFP